MEGDAARSNHVPIDTLAGTLRGWDGALRAALPSMIAHGASEDPELLRRLDRATPLAGPSAPGSFRQSYGLEVLGPAGEPDLFDLSPTALDDLLHEFESGVARLQLGEVSDWITPEVAKPLTDAVASLTRHGLTLQMEEVGKRVDQQAEATLRAFIKKEADSRKAELQVLGVLSSVSVKNSYLFIDSTRQGSLRITFPKTEARALCDAMASRDRVEIVVDAVLSSGGKLENANFRTMRRLGPRPNYQDTFQRLWGSRRDMYDGVVRDDRGVPDPDPEPDD